MTPINSNVRVAGSGLVTSVGSSVDTTWLSALNGDSGLREYSGGGCYVAQIDVGKETDKLYTIAHESLSECIKDAGWDKFGDDTALIFSVGSPDNNFIVEEADRLHTKNRIRPDTVYRSMLSYVGAKLSKEFQIHGPVITTAAACAGSSHALHVANALLASGAVKRCLCGGGEVLDRFTIEAFKSMRRVLSSQVDSGPECIQPFGSERSGIALGEGCGWLALERADSESDVAEDSIYISDVLAINAPAAVYGDVTCPDDWKRLLADTPSSMVDLVVAHATSTPKGDLAEGKAIQAHFTEAQTRSTKYLFGHALSASTIIDLVMIRKAMQSGKVPGLGHDYQLDDELKGLKVCSSTMDLDLNHVAKLTTAFGGAMGKVVLRKGR